MCGVQYIMAYPSSIMAARDDDGDVMDVTFASIVFTIVWAVKIIYNILLYGRGEYYTISELHA